MARPRGTRSSYRKFRNKPGAPEPRKAALYARVSTADQEREGYSIPAQIKLLEDYAALNGLTIASHHVDVESARKAGRKAFGEMLRHLARYPDIRILLVEKTDRLYRNIKDWAIIDDLGLDIHFVREGLVFSDKSQSSEKFIHGIKVLMAKNYIDNLSEEAAKGMREKARQGVWPSVAPLGYRNVAGADGRKTIAVDPVSGPLVARLFEWFATGAYSIKGVTERARLAGLKGKRGVGPIGHAAVHHLLRNRFYTGSFNWAGETHAGVHEPLVSVELWAVAQEVLDGRAHSNTRADRRIFPFTGLIQCGHCGCALVAEIKKGRYIYYHCTGYRGKCPERYVRQEVLEDRIVEALRRLSCGDRAFELLRGELGAELLRTDEDPINDPFRRNRWLIHSSAALTRDLIGLLDLARNAHRILPALSAAMKQQVLGLVLSHGSWANERLSVTFCSPFTVFAQWAVGAGRHGDEGFPGRALATLRTLLQDAPSDTRRLITRYNAMMGHALETGQGSSLLPSSDECALEAA